MTKMMAALRGEGLDALLEDDALSALALAGVERLQVNLDDEHVADAMRIPVLEPPVGAVVSAWTETPDTAVSVLHGVAARVDAWLVDERRPLPPSEEWDGSRLDGLANVALLRLPDELTHEEWLDRWLGDHTPVAIETQATFGYLQNVVQRALTPEAPPVAGIVEELFPTAAIGDPHAFYGSGGDDAELAARIERLMASVARIGADRDLDLIPTSRYLLDLTPLRA